MNLLHKTNLRQLVRFVETGFPTTASKFLVESLTKRALIRVQGSEAVPFLQGLITNDMNHLNPIDGNPSMFTMFLNNAGRVLYDSIIYRTPDRDTFIIECDREVSNELRKHLRLYRVRRKINVDCVNDELSPWIIFNPEQGSQLPKFESTADSNTILSSPDPRLKQLGVRIIQPTNNDLNSIEKAFPNCSLEHATSDQYTAHRYAFGVGEGVVDHPPGKCFPLEANCDFLHGVSFHKGCYVGQELTARVYHTGVIRKRLMPLKLTNIPKANVSSVQTAAGTAVGTIRGICGIQALALLRVEQVLKANKLLIDGEPCTTFKPDWWPKELPNRASMRKD